jgi:hypothetical protein
LSRRDAGFLGATAGGF